MMRQKIAKAYQWGQLHWRKLLLYGGGGVALLFIVVQLFYPNGRMPLFASVDDVNVSGWKKEDAEWELNNRYKQQQVQLYFGDTKNPYHEPSVGAIGLTISNGQRIEATSYNWWLRLIPTSLFWGHAVVKTPAPVYEFDQAKVQQYINAELGESCDVKPKNASLTVKDDSLQVQPAVPGGTCKTGDVKTALTDVRPALGKSSQARVPMNVIAPAITDDQAKKLLKALDEKIGQSITISANNQPVSVDKKTLLSWLDFATPENEIILSINKDRSSDFMAKQVAPKVAKVAGVSKVTTTDFTETARVNGATGVALNVDQTLQSMQSFLTGGSSDVTAATSVVQPKVEYTRNYSPTDTGLSALMKQYAESHPGKFGISMVELSGKNRRATFNDSQRFRTASRYKLYVAYSTLKRVEAGTWKWSDQIQGGRNLEKCFDDMIVRSDNPCGEALLNKVGFRPLTDEMKALGLTNTSFVGTIPETSAGDLTTFMGSLESGQILSSDSRSRLLGALKRNIYRQGIPAGANGQVANKVGFLDGLLHDAAIIYGPTGPVVLSIMSDGSSWATLADLTRQIETLRAQ